MSEPPSKCRRVELTLEDKIKLIKDSEMMPKPTLKTLGEKYGVGKSTVSDLLKKKEFYRQQWENNVSSKKIRFNNSKCEKLNDLLWSWFSKARSKNIPISGVLIQEKALEYAKELELVDFKASHRWLDRWKIKYSVKGYKVSGESASVNCETVSDFKKESRKLSVSTIKRTFSVCDETELYFRALPDKTLGVKGQSTSGTKVSKDPVTVLFACSASGEKLKPLLIGKSLNPRCLKKCQSKCIRC